MKAAFKEEKGVYRRGISFKCRFDENIPKLKPLCMSGNTRIQLIPVKNVQIEVSFPNISVRLYLVCVCVIYGNMCLLHLELLV